MTQSTPLRTCRVCGNGSALREVLDMGLMPLANRLLTADELKQPEPRYPLKLMFCPECGLAQLSETVAPEAMYTDYTFRTSSSAAMVEHFSRLMNENVQKYVPQGGLVVEIGSNDGSALASLRNRPVRVIGVDPAINIDSGDVPTLQEFFDPEVASNIAEYNGMAHLIAACNVLAHVDEVHEFLKGVKTLLHPEGALVIEVPRFERTLVNGDWDQIYHEHLSYYTVASLTNLLARHDFGVFSVEYFAVHGGSMRVTALPGASSRHMRTPEAMEPPDEMEVKLERFAESAKTQRCGLMRRVTTMVEKEGKEIIAYGAAAKGAIVLNWCDFGGETIPLVIDNTPGKIGKFMPGTNQLIVEQEDVNLSEYDAVLLLAWNHRHEIENKLRAGGFLGRVMVPHA